MRVIMLALLLCCLLAQEGGKGQSPLEVLNLPPGASRQEIRKAFKELPLQYHPDISYSARKHNERIIEAYEALKKEDNDPLPNY
jgi:DnaJ-class molecular chaperone